MKVELSFLSDYRSFIGIEVQRGGYLVRDKDGDAAVARTVEIGIGFIFGWLTVQIPNGSSFKLNDVNEMLRNEALKQNKI
jgi:hypothetical protein